MLRVCALNDKKSWDKCLPYAEFSYNINYQESLKMFWNEPGENQVFGPEILREAERHVQVIRENLQLAQSRQKATQITREGT
jgi:hypothetical protein